MPATLSSGACRATDSGQQRAAHAGCRRSRRPRGVDTVHDGHHQAGDQQRQERGPGGGGHASSVRPARPPAGECGGPTGWSRPRTLGGSAHPDGRGLASEDDDVPTDADDLPRTLLITLTGEDRPGVTSAIFATLARAGVEVLDIEQIVLRAPAGARRPGHRPAGLEAGSATRWSARRTSLAMHVEVTRGVGDNRTRAVGRSHVTVIGVPLKATAFAAVAGRIADSGANIDRIERMARYPVTAIDLHVSGADPERLRRGPRGRGGPPGHRHRRPAGQPAAPRDAADRDGRRLHADPGRGHRDARGRGRLRGRGGPASPRRRCAGELDFEESLRERVALLAGLDAGALDRVYDRDRAGPRAPGPWSARCAGSGYRFALVSGGFSQITDRLADDLDVHYSRANELEIVDGRLTGRIVGDVVDRAGKAAALREFAAEVGVGEASVIAIGDGANDLDMLNAAGLGIAYNAKPVVQRRRAHVGERALPRRDHLPARHLPRGDRGRRRRGGHRHAGAAGLTVPSGSGQPRGRRGSPTTGRRPSRGRPGAVVLEDRERARRDSRPGASRRWPRVAVTVVEELRQRWRSSGCGRRRPAWLTSSGVSRTRSRVASGPAE